MGIDDDNGAGTPAGPDDRPMTSLETARELSFAKLRIAELEAQVVRLQSEVDQWKRRWEGAKQLAKLISG